MKVQATHPSREEGGQILVMAALTLVILLGFMALAIDVGFWLSSKTDAQGDADAMALAGALELPNKVLADTEARHWGTKNKVSPSQITSIAFDADPCREPAPEAHYITVRLSRDQPSFFGRILGVTGTTITVCATAQASIEDGPYAIFANHSCPDTDTLKMPGSDSQVFGSIHSNCHLEVSGSTNSLMGPVTYSGTFTNGGGGNIYLEGQSKTGIKAFPVLFTYSDFLPHCTFTVNGDLDLSKSEYYKSDGTTLKDGIYCQTNSEKKYRHPNKAPKAR